MNIVKGFSLSNIFFFSYQHSYQLLVLSSNSWATTQSSRKAKRQFSTMIRIPNHLSNQYLLILESHLSAPRVRSSLGKPTSLLWYLLYLQILTRGPPKPTSSSNSNGHEVPTLSHSFTNVGVSCGCPTYLSIEFWLWLRVLRAIRLTRFSSSNYHSSIDSRSMK